MYSSLLVNLTMTSCFTLFYILLIIIYFSKKNMPNIENKIYRVMLVFNGISLITILLMWVLLFFFHENPSNVGYFNNVYSLFIIYWCAGLSFYLLVISNEKNNKLIENIKKNKVIYISIFIIVALLASVFYLNTPYNLYMEDGALKTGDNTLSVKFNLYLLVLFIISTISIIINFNKFNHKKIIPIVLSLLLWVIAIAFMFIDSTILFGHCVITVNSLIMYFTIENPDVKLVNQLTLAKNEAEKASNAKSEFLSSMSHELRTPLNAIVGLSTMIKDNSTDPDSRNDAADIYKASSNLLELVDGILDVNKLESNQMEIVENKYNLRDVLDSVVRSAKIRIGNKQLELKTSFSEDIPNYLYGDSEKIKIILNQLLSNAVKYTESGFIKLSVDAFTNKDKCNLTFTVSDTGRGIPEDKIENLFTKFYRLDEDKDSDIEGTGLGLSITKSLVELLNGKINVYSTYGEGSTFTITISQMVFIEDNNTEIL